MPGTYLIVGLVIALFSVGFIAMSRHVRRRRVLRVHREGLGTNAGGGLGSALAVPRLRHRPRPAMYGAVRLRLSASPRRPAGLDVAWWGCALITMAVITGPGRPGASTSACGVLACSLLLEVVVLLVLDVAVLANGGARALRQRPRALLRLRLRVRVRAAVVRGRFTGFEATVVFSEEAKEPGSTSRARRTSRSRSSPASSP